jgi:hypothetical protein
MAREVYFQAEMFSGDLVDSRTETQKKRARELGQPRQAEMFSQRELAQFGVTEPIPSYPSPPRPALSCWWRTRERMKRRSET